VKKEEDMSPLSGEEDACIIELGEGERGKNASWKGRKEDTQSPGRKASGFKRGRLGRAKGGGTGNLLGKGIVFWPNPAGDFLNEPW